MNQHLYLLTVLCLSALTGCVVPDPLYTANAGRLQDTEYPASKAHGIWATMAVAPIQTNLEIQEKKSYYALQAGGTGTIRQAIANRASGESLSVEAPLRWRYEGRNYWRVITPSSDKFRTTGRKGNWNITPSPGHETLVRYFDGNFYEPSAGRVWVPANRSNVSSMAERQRSVPPALRITLPE